MAKTGINAAVAILSIIVVLIGLYQIFGLGESNWANYLATILFAVVFIISLYNMRE